MDMDHWRISKAREFGPWEPPPRPPPLEKYVRPPKGPRLHMGDYTYPEEFDLGSFQRVRELNLMLQTTYRSIGNASDSLADKTYDYKESREIDDPLEDFYRGKMREAKAVLQERVNEASALLAELDAIGAPYQIPDQLKDVIEVKQYVPFGSLAYLPGVNFYHSEDIGDVDATDNQKLLLQKISVIVNRATFLQECGYAFRERYQYAVLYKRLKSEFQKLQDSNFQMNLKPALINRAREILSQEPERVKVERLKEEEEKRKKEVEEKREKRMMNKKQRFFRSFGLHEPSPSTSSGSSETAAVEVLGAVEDVEVHGDAEGVPNGDGDAEEKVHGDAAVEQGQVQLDNEIYGVAWCGQHTYLDNEVHGDAWSGQHTYFLYPSDEEY